MDLERRLGEGRLAQLAGPSAVGSDKFELRLGLLRTAQQEWAAAAEVQPGRAGPGRLRPRGERLPGAGPRQDGQWPAVFSLAGVYPANWTPVDSLIIQGDADPGTGLHHHTAGLRAAGPVARHGPDHVLVPDPAAEPAEPLRSRPVPHGRPGPDSRPARGQRDPPNRHRHPPAHPAGRGGRGGALLAQVAALPAGQVHGGPDSNAWAANGPLVAGDGAMLAGDPHLPQTLPSIWYQVALAAPGLDVSGVSVPGLPSVLIGHNQHIAWSLTDTQNQAVLFYTERTSQQPARPVLLATAPGAGCARCTTRSRSAAARTSPLTVDITVHGPIMTQAGQTIAVDWMGRVPSPDLAVMLAVNRASDWAQFRAALANWHAPGAELRLRRRPRQHRRHLGRLLPAGAPRRPVAADARHRRRRRDRRDPLRGGAAGLRPARARGGHRQPAPGRRFLPVLHRHHGELLRPRLPGRPDLRQPARPVAACHRPASPPCRATSPTRWRCASCPNCWPRCAVPLSTGPS